ncbi:hypothetical protein PENARI_c160G06646 [Penicillium arizonense]|uniref:C2H2-type domain-containing protein n=1 Tax=Penicillium arizonense TaxID=1835702 RepID=A0A1F5L0W7_PENAI|nr:hypothetical protein PENARI_c160G06646 [Penicillium arizonense]OGE46630.1 hypothetical protein PENARI_c160G06646 [Penicillium arizonense]
MPPTFASFLAQKSRFMLSVGDSSQMVQQATATSSQACETDMLFPSDTLLFYGDRSEQKDLIDLIPTEQPGMEFHQHEKCDSISHGLTHPLHISQTRDHGHLCQQMSCSIPGSSHCGWRPVVCWFRYQPIWEPSNSPLEASPGHFDLVPNLHGTCPLPAPQNTNDPWLERLGGHHVGQDTQVAEACHVFRQSPNPIRTQDSSDFGHGRPQASTPRQQFNCWLSGCKRQFKRQKTLNRHLASHSGARPHVCWVPGCQRSFSRRDNLNAHYKTHGKRGGRNRYVATLDKAGTVYNPEFCGQLTPEGWPLDHARHD